MTAPRRRRRTRPRSFYAPALPADEAAALTSAESTGLDDEVALVRWLVRRELAGDAPDTRQLLSALTLLTRLVVARHRLSPAEGSDLERRIVAAIGSLTATLDGEEDGDA